MQNESMSELKKRLNSSSMYLQSNDMQVVEDLCAGLRQLGIQPETLSYPFVVTRYNGLECGM